MWCAFPSISLSNQLINELQSVAGEPQQGPKRLRLLCSAILREITPTSQLVIANVEPPVEQKNIPIILPLVWVQVCCKTMSELIKQCIMQSLLRSQY